MLKYIIISMLVFILSSCSNNKTNDKDFKKLLKEYNIQVKS